MSSPVEDPFTWLCWTRSIPTTIIIDDALRSAGIEFRKDDSGTLPLGAGGLRNTLGTIYFVRKSAFSAANSSVDRALGEAIEQQEIRRQLKGDATCLACGAEMKDDETICPKCGWTFADDSTSEERTGEG